MKNLKQFCVTILLACACIQPAWAGKYCETATDFNSGQGKSFSCDLTLNYEEGKYVVILANMQMGGQAFYFDTSNMSGWTFTDGDRTAEKRFDVKPSNISFCGWNKSAQGYATNQIWYHSPANYTLPSAEWEGACAPDDETPPTITRLTAENKQNKKADIRVEATDAVGVTHVQILNGVTMLIDEDVTPTTSLNQAFTISGLTKNTEYTFTVICSDAAGNNSTSQNITFTTTNTPVKTVYFVNAGTSSSWVQPYIYYWGGTGGSAFPGTPMDNTGWTNCDGTSIWTADVESDNTTCIFNQGNSTGQTGDKAIFEDQFYNYESGGYGAWFSIADGIYMMGEMTNWTDDKASDKAFSTWTGGSPTYVTWTKRLAEGTTYQFRILHKKDGTWQWAGNTGTITSSTSFSPRWWEMNQYSSGDANNCRITTSIAGKYKFYYDFTANRLKVDYPTPPVGCSGTTGNPTTGSGPRINYSFTYAGGKIYVTAIPTDNAAFDNCYFKYCNNTSGTGEVSVLMALSADKKEATYELTAPYASGTNMYFKFQYKAGTMGSQGETCSGWNSAPTYTIGNCKPEDDIPFMISASQASATTTSVTLNVSGVVNIDGVENPTTQYVVSTNGGSTWSSPLTASGGKITVTGLSANTVYTVLVKAYYNGEESTNTKTVSANTNPESQCSGTRSDVNYSLSYRLDGSIPVLTITARSNTANAITAMRTHWLTYDNLSGAYQNYHNADENTADHPQSATVDAGVATITYRLTAADAGRIMLLRLGYNIGAGEVWTAGDVNADRYNANNIFYIVGECPAETDPPCMSSVTVQTEDANSVVLNVSATDGTQPDPTTFRVSTSSTFDTYTDYGATTGRITVTGLAPCTGYTLYVAAVDANGNVSTDNETASCQTKQVSFTTTAPLTTDNLALGRECGGTLTDNTEERPPRAFDGDKTGTTSYTSYTANGNATTLWVNLGSLQEVNKVRIYWGTDFSNNYKIEYSEDGTDYTTAITFTANPINTNNCSNYQEHTFETVNARYVRLQTVSTNWVRIYEFEVYGTGECPITQEEPQMTFAAATDERAEEAVLHLTSRDNETSAANMIYHLNVRSTSRDLTNWDLTLTGEASGDYTIKGLVPGTDYTVTVYCEDEDGNLSTADVNTPEHKQRTFSFTTSNGGGNNCTKTWEWADIADIDDPSFNEWPADKYRFELEVAPVNDGGTYKINFRFTVTDLVGTGTMGNTYLHIDRDGWQQEHMGAEHDWTFDEKYASDDPVWVWNADNRVGIKCELSTGACIVGPFIINPAQMIDDFIHGTGDCGAGTFVITQKGRTPNITLPDGYNGTFAEQILYYRQFSPGQWEPICFPFAVSSVEVYDPDENEMFPLTPVTTSNPNGYYLLRQQVANVSGADFKESWYDGTDNVPQKKTAYNIFFPMNNGWGEFYTNKYVLFRGTDGAQTVETSFSRGDAPTADDQYTLYGNNTLSTTTLTAYFETNDGKFYEKEENRTLQPFECYVLANATTLSRMPRIAPWKGVPTDIENTWAETTFLPNAAVYNTFGQLIFTMQNTVFYDVMERCMTLPAGCYIVISELGTQKIIIP